METWRRRTAYYLVGLAAIIAAYTGVYHWAMTAIEGREVTVLHSLQVVVETFTTTGFGSDAPWTTPELNALVVVMDLTGVVLIFMALPVLVFPLFEETLERRAPTRMEGLSDHVVVGGYSSRGRALVEELEARGREYVVMEPDGDRANRLYAEEGLTVVHGDPVDAEDLADVCSSDARAVVADVGDEGNASVVLAARDHDAPVVTFAEDSEIATYHRYAGAADVLSPRRLVGESLARKVTVGVTPDLDGAVEIAEDFDIVELPVQAGSELAGTTVGDSGIRERTGANVVGAWFRGEFVSPPPPDARIDGQTILVVAGRERQLERLMELTLSAGRRGSGEGVVVAGHGEVGSTVVETIGDAASVTVIDLSEGEGVDVVGDATDPETLEAAGIHEASTVILALSDDTQTAFATLVVRDLEPDVEVIARADETDSVRKLYQAGADYVLAVATVAGRMLASTILQEEVISFDQQVDVVRIGCGALAGKTLGGADVRAKTGATVIAVERDGETLTDLDASFRFERGDEFVAAGTDDDVNRLATLVEG